jgi:hypothetical protein
MFKVGSGYTSVPMGGVRVTCPLCQGSGNYVDLSNVKIDEPKPEPPKPKAPTSTPVNDTAKFEAEKKEACPLAKKVSTKKKRGRKKKEEPPVLEKSEGATSTFRQFKMPKDGESE